MTQEGGRYEAKEKTKGMGGNNAKIRDVSGKRPIAWVQTKKNSKTQNKIKESGGLPPQRI